MWTTIIDAQDLAGHVDDPRWVVFDCRFDLADAGAGYQAYVQGHIPGAHYVHLEHDLSSPVTSSTGRHPLPDAQLLSRKLGQWGVDDSKQVVAYDGGSGAFAARLWWLLRWLGHHGVAVLDGGVAQWQRGGYPLSTDIPQPRPAVFQPHRDDTLWLSAERVAGLINDEDYALVDARAAERFNGDVEPIDPVAGHIPGAVNRPFMRNVDEQGRFLPAEDLRREFAALTGGVSPGHVIHMCGSGVTACHNLLAMEVAGLHGAKLYAGSWSEWITDASRPVVSAPGRGG